eukprot:jgi/Chlat1/7591/Chrsp63S09151
MPIRALNVAEKPSVAKEVARILSHGQMQTRDGFSQYNRVFDFDYQINGQNMEMMMTSVTGHLMELEFDAAYKKWTACQPVVLFDAHVRKQVAKDKLPLEKTLQREARRAQWLVLWLDCDREGENIAFEVIEVCKGANPRLQVFRARFSALIPRDIEMAAQNLQAPDERAAAAVDARQEIDLRIGAAFTRFQTLLLQVGATASRKPRVLLWWPKDRFDMPEEFKASIISYGPCQFPTLGFVVERYWQIKAHVPEDFWRITFKYVDPVDNIPCHFDWARGRLFDHAAATVLYEMCVEDTLATVVDVKGSERKKYPPFPLNTVELQKRASRYLRLGSETVMKIAEELYQEGYISYPRTETDSFPQNMDLRAVVAEHQHNPEWGQYAQRLLDPQGGLWRNPANGGHNDQAHPPIGPTKPAAAGMVQWSENKWRLYEFIVRHFLACASMPAIGYETVVDISISGEGFTARGMMITARNYLDVYRYENWGDRSLPSFHPGQQFMPTALELAQSQTEPPHLLSESELIGLMDTNGIGTDATMHDHIKTITKRNYAIKNNRQQFTPTPLGEALVLGYDAMGYDLWKPALRAAMEADMKRVGVGSKTKQAAVLECLTIMKQTFSQANAQKDKLLEAMTQFFAPAAGNHHANNSGHNGAQGGSAGEFVRACPMCNCNFLLRQRPENGKFFIGCSGFPQCRNVLWLPTATLETQVTTETCAMCQPAPVYMVRFKFNRVSLPLSMGHMVNYVGCVGCDGPLLDLFEMCNYGGPGGGGGGGGGGGPGNGGGGNSRPPGGSAPFAVPTQNAAARASASTNHHRPAPAPAPSTTAPSQARPAARAPPFNPYQPAPNHGFQPASNLNMFPGGGYQAAADGSGFPSSSHHPRSGPGSARRGGQQETGNRGTARRGAQPTGHSAIPHCNCGTPATERTANTATNPNRVFYTCNVCHYFQWRDELGNAARSNAATGASRNRSGSQSAARGARGRGRGRAGKARGGAGRASASASSGCFKCGEQGHFASGCPNQHNFM